MGKSSDGRWFRFAVSSGMLVSVQDPCGVDAMRHISSIWHAEKPHVH